MNKFKKQKVINEIVKMPATTETIEIIADTINHINKNNHDYDYKFLRALEARLGMVIYCIYRGIYSVDIIPKKPIMIRNSNLYSHKILISRELIQRTKDIENEFIFKLRALDPNYRLHFTHFVTWFYQESFGETKFETKFPSEVQCLTGNVLVDNSDKDLIKEYRRIEDESKTPKEFINNLFSHHLIYEYYAENLKQSVFAQYAYKKLGITNEEFSKIIKEIKTKTRIKLLKDSIRECISRFNKGHTNNEMKCWLSRDTVELSVLGELTEWEPLFSYRINKNKNKSYDYYLKNKDEDGWCKITRSKRRNSVFSKLIYTGQAQLEIRGKEEWIKITLD